MVEQHATFHVGQDLERIQAQVGHADQLLHKLIQFVQEQFSGANQKNQTFQAAMVEGCQGIYTEMKTIEAAHNALNRATFSLVHKHNDVAASLNTTTQSVLAIQQVMGEMRNHIGQVESKGANMKKQASRTVNVFAQKITAIENACALTVQQLTAQLTEQCRIFNSTLERFRDQINNQENLVDSIKTQDKQWAEHHFTL
jgi:hypothetical protein